MHRCLVLLFLAPISVLASGMPPDSELDRLVSEAAARQRRICYLGNCNRLKDVAIGIVDKNGVKIRNYFEGKFNPNPKFLSYGIGSISKSFAATALLLMVEEGKIDLDRPASEYLPKAKGGKPAPVPSFDGHPITIRHLLTHTAGLPAVPDEPPQGATDSQHGWFVRNHYTIEHAYKYLSTLALHTKPGRKFQYASFDYALLTAIIAHVEKKEFARVINDRIIKPLGMKQTGIRLPSAQLITPYGATGKEIPKDRRWYTHPTIFDGAGGVQAAPEDLARYVAAHLGLGTFGSLPEKLQKALLSTQELQGALMPAENDEEKSHDIQPVAPPSTKDFMKIGDEDYLALGWFSRPKQKRMNHGGSVLGYKSRIFLDRKNEPVGVFVLSNSELNGADEVAKPLARSVINLYVYCSTDATELIIARNGTCP